MYCGVNWHLRIVFHFEKIFNGCKSILEQSYIGVWNLPNNSVRTIYCRLSFVSTNLVPSIQWNRSHWFALAWKWRLEGMWETPMLLVSHGTVGVPAGTGGVRDAGGTPGYPVIQAKPSKASLSIEQSKMISNNSIIQTNRQNTWWWQECRQGLNSMIITLHSKYVDVHIRFLYESWQQRTRIWVTKFLIQSS